MQEASYTDLDDLAALLQHGDVVVCNAGTILLDALVGDRPAVCVLYDEGAPPGDSWAAKNVVGKHYEELAASGAFYRAERFEEVVAGIERALERPGELAAERAAWSTQVVGEVDGRAGRARGGRDPRGARWASDRFGARSARLVRDRARTFQRGVRAARRSPARAEKRVVSVVVQLVVVEDDQARWESSRRHASAASTSTSSPRCEPST